MTRDELLRILESEEHVKEFLDQYDTDKDGVISYEEFLHAWLDRVSPRKEAELLRWHIFKDDRDRQ